MFCPNCGAPLGEQDKFCKACGTPSGAQAQAQAPVQEYAQPAPVQEYAQPAAPVIQQFAQPMVQPVVQPAAPVQEKPKKGLINACFITGLLSSILLFLIDGIILIVSAMILFVTPIAMALGANFEDQFVMGLAICVVAAVAVAAAVVGLIFNCISTKKTKRRPEKKCKTFRLISAILTLAVSFFTIVPLIIGAAADFEAGIGVAGFLLFIEMILAIVHFVLALITNSKTDNGVNAL